MEPAPRPGLYLTVTVFSLNMFGDAARGLLYPRLKDGVSNMSLFPYIGAGFAVDLNGIVLGAGKTATLAF